MKKTQLSNNDFLKELNSTTEIGYKLRYLKEKITSQPLSVKESIDKILKENQTLINGDYIEFELLQTKAKAFELLNDFKQAIEIYNKSISTIYTKIDFSDDPKINKQEKQKILIETIEQKLDLYIKNAWQIFEENGEINQDILKEFDDYFDKDGEILNHFGLAHIAVYYKSFFYQAIGDTKKAFEYLESASLLGNKQAIESYTSTIINSFLDSYEYFKKQGIEKQFLEENLEEFEEVIFQYIDDYYINENGEREHTPYGGNKELYEKVGDFYIQIEKYYEAISSYVSGLQSSYPKSYALYGKLGELYEKYPKQLKVYNQENIQKLAIDNYTNYYRISQLVGDFEHYILGIEKLGDYYKHHNDKELAQKYYHSAINELINKNEDSYFSNKTLSNLLIKTNREGIEIKYPDGIYEVNLEGLYQILAEKYDGNYILTLANHYEEKGNILHAFFNYLLAYGQGITDSKDAFLMFLEHSLTKYLEEKNQKEILEPEGTEKAKMLQEEINDIQKATFKLQKILLNKIITNLEKNDFTEEDIGILLNMILGDKFYNNFEYNDLVFYLENHHNKIPFSNIMLHKILVTVFEKNGTNMNLGEVKGLLEKIIQFKEIDDHDLVILNKYISLDINSDEISIEYGNGIYILDNSTKKSDYGKNTHLFKKKKKK